LALPPPVRELPGAGGPCRGRLQTDDHGLDLIVHPDGRREWKDVEHLSGQLREGRIDQSTVLDVLAETETVLREPDSGDPWWLAWDDWTPPVA
jgi:predicted RNA-binding protein associated with RNAse of E/G family